MDGTQASARPMPPGGNRRGSWLDRADAGDLGRQLHEVVSDIFPICRSITGDGVRQTLALLSRVIPLQRHEVPTGTAVFDWTIPREWNIRDAWIKSANGTRVVDFRRCNLHVMSYSTPVHARMSLADLSRFIFTLPQHPDVIPYRTSYYAERWGFCMAHTAFLALPDGEYEVMIDSSLEDGSLSYGEFFHQGATDNEILISAHICHPSMANDNCSGLAVAALLADRVSRLRTRHSFRFLFAPGTIGAITWLARNQQHASRIKHGLVLSCVGDDGPAHYKRSRHGTAIVDRAMIEALAGAAIGSTVLDFEPYGYDERQFGSPGFDLPVGLFQRGRFGAFPQYHTSADDLSFVTPTGLAKSFEIIASALSIIEADRTMVNLRPWGEPQLGRRGLYAAVGGDPAKAARNMALLWVLNQSDGSHSLLDIAEKARIRFDTIADAAALLEADGLLADAGSRPSRATDGFRQ